MANVLALLVCLPAVMLTAAAVSQAASLELFSDSLGSPPPQGHIAQASVSIQSLQQTAGVSITGQVRSVMGNEFVLDDGTGQIIVDAGPRWYHTISVSVSERLTVVGSYDDDDFDAYTITRGNGEVIQIRPASGPPP